MPAAQMIETRSSALYFHAKPEQDIRHAEKARETRRRQEDRAERLQHRADTANGWDTPPSCPARRIVRPR
ncbi:hypothetical protein [Chromobacterium haemolyticum]|nr:hypothetical protein [Chromobacterium haemolyticum]